MQGCLSALAALQAAAVLAHMPFVFGGRPERLQKKERAVNTAEMKNESHWRPVYICFFMHIIQTASS